jgi:hypothetical protein
MPGLLVIVSSGTPFTTGAMLRKAFIIMGININGDWKWLKIMMEKQMEI